MAERNGSSYVVESDLDHHRAVLEIVASTQARVAISGYDNEMYQATLDKRRWTALRRRVVGNSQAGAARVDRVEVLWVNYGVQETLL
jgi:hypothetical protein